MARFRVKPNMTFGPAGVYPAGTDVELTVEEAQPFLDKLIPLDDSPPVLKNDLGAQVPASQKVLRKKQTEE